MTHKSENVNKLRVINHSATSKKEMLDLINGFNGVCLVVLPPHDDINIEKKELKQLFSDINTKTEKNATLITLGEPQELVYAHAGLANLTYQLWISIKRKNIKKSNNKTSLPQEHFGALIHTNYSGSLKHTITRVAYSYCPACNRTTKDYGGKKHTYNSYGTLISDVWRDITCDLEGDLEDVFVRISDMFGIEMYTEMRIIDLRNFLSKDKRISEIYTETYTTQPTFLNYSLPNDNESQLLHGDSIENLKAIPDNSVDFSFIDPPYNLGKKYNTYADDLSIQEYFSWCDEWISQVIRILRPGRTLALLNIPLWSIRHFLFMDQELRFQNWITWDALSFPVRKIMPAHYAILIFSKGHPRPLPSLVNESEDFSVPTDSRTFVPHQPLDDRYCLRSSCIRQRNSTGFTDRAQLTDLWSDIHRLKHNSRRVDHPCQLPPQLMYRLISTFTNSNEKVLDCFNGAGTTTLTAHQMGRQYIGIELSEKYYKITEKRHEEIRNGLNPFRKVKRTLTEKNSPVPRLAKKKYDVPKKTLQLEVRRVALEIKKIPSRDEMILHGRYPIKYYDEYFFSWGEVCAAARHDGMSENRQNKKAQGKQQHIQQNLFNRGPRDAKR